MKKSRTCCCILLALPPVLGTPGCGAGGRALESITIVGQGGSSVETIVSASGTFNSSPIPQTNLPARWYLLGPGLDPPPTRLYPDQPKFCPALQILYGDRRCADGPKYSRQRNDPGNRFSRIWSSPIQGRVRVDSSPRPCSARPAASHTSVEKLAAPHAGKLHRISFRKIFPGMTSPQDAITIVREFPRRSLPVFPLPSLRESANTWAGTR